MKNILGILSVLLMVSLVGCTPNNKIEKAKEVKLGAEICELKIKDGLSILITLKDFTIEKDSTINSDGARHIRINYLLEYKIKSSDNTISKQEIINSSDDSPLIYKYEVYAKDMVNNEVYGVSKVDSLKRYLEERKDDFKNGENFEVKETLDFNDLSYQLLNQCNIEDIGILIRIDDRYFSFSK